MAALFPPSTPRWPFFLGDAVLVVFSFVLFYGSPASSGCPVLIACTVCIALGAFLGVLPFLLDDRAARRQEEAAGLASTVNQIQNLESLAGRIADATAQWQSIHDQASQTATAARSTAEAMSTEMKSFIEFLEKANDSERQHLRLEVEKLKRGESDWVAVLVRVMDHVYAIHAAGVRSGQPTVINQLTQFQNACRDAIRRVGLAPVDVEPGTPFDPEKHQLPPDVPARPGARVAGTLATGFTLRGERIRPPLVQVVGQTSDAPGEPAEHSESSPAQTEPSEVDPELPM